MKEILYNTDRNNFITLKIINESAFNSFRKCFGYLNWSSLSPKFLELFTCFYFLFSELDRWLIQISF